MRVFFHKKWEGDFFLDGRFTLLLKKKCCFSWFRDVWLNDHLSSIYLAEFMADWEVSVTLPEPRDSSICIVTPAESTRCERAGRFEFGPDNSADFFERNSRGDMLVPLHLSCLRMIEQVERYRKFQDHGAPTSPGSVEVVYMALCRQKRCKGYLYGAPYTRVYMGDQDHDFHGFRSDPRKDISWIAIGAESVGDLFLLPVAMLVLRTNAFSEQSG